MADRLRFEHRRESSRWFAEIDSGACYRIEMEPTKLGADYYLTFMEREADTGIKKGWKLRYENVSRHRSLERAIERANHHHRNRAKIAKA